MTIPSKRAAQRARERIERIRTSLGGFELLCSGTLSQRMMTCGKPNCRCASDPSARHGPYYQWVRMRAGKPTQRYVSDQQAQLLRQAIGGSGKTELLRRNIRGMLDADEYP